jgi:hypothetical protein
MFITTSSVFSTGEQPFHTCVKLCWGIVKMLEHLPNMYLAMISNSTLCQKQKGKKKSKSGVLKNLPSLYSTLSLIPGVSDIQDFH